MKYFERKLYKSLGVPISRLEAQQGFSLGRTTEITRDELKFTKLVQRLRNKFSTLFDDLLRVQLVLKKVCTEEEWKEFKEDVWYDYKKDNNFTEIKEAELLTSRMQTLGMVQPFVGLYYSKEWVRKNVLQLTEEDIKEIDKQIAEEAAQNPPPAVDANGQPLPAGAPAVGPDGQPMPMQGQPMVNINQPPPIPSKQIQQLAQGDQVPQEDGSRKDQTDPLLDQKKLRFVNDSMEAA